MAESQLPLFETKAPQAFMIEAQTGAILFAKDPDKLIAPASLAKLMTMEVVFHALKTGKATLADTFKVSENAWRTGGAPSGTSTMFAALNSTLTLSDLIQGVIVQSANDGCIIIAEGMAGSEAAFAEMMNERAHAIGMTRSVFKNSTGLPAQGQVVTLRELAMLGRHIWQEYPDYYRYYSQPAFEWNKIFQRNRNPLLRLQIGADGMGTGYTEASGYALLGAIERDGTRLFAAMAGMTSEAERATEAQQFMEWGLTGFVTRDLFAAGDKVGEVALYGGTTPTLSVRTNRDVTIFVPEGEPERVQARIAYDGPISAPVEQGTRIGALEVRIDDVLSVTEPVYAATDARQGTLSSRAADAMKELAIGWMR